MRKTVAFTNDPDRRPPPRLLLDTCAIIYLLNAEAMDSFAIAAIDSASVLVSPISAWEIGLLSRKRTLGGPIFLPDAVTWFRTALRQPNITTTFLDADIALSSALLPEPLHRDPADRFLIATARSLAIPIVTRDRLILTYADDGHLDAIRC